MSSFIVDDKTINSIVTFIYTDKDSTRFVAQLSALGLSTRPQDLGEHMYRLNLAAVEDRYGDYSAGTMCSLDYRYRKVTADKIQVLKNLRCWLYQCSEGDVPNAPLYKLMDAYSGELALDIVRELPEYSAANWGQCRPLTLSLSQGANAMNTTAPQECTEQDSMNVYAVKCDDCKRTICYTGSVKESYQGGRCNTCVRES